MSAPNSIEINFKSCHLSVQKSVTVHLRLGCCLRWHFPHRHKIRFCNRAKQNFPTYLLISNTLPLKTPLKTALSYRKSQGLNFGEGILEHGMSWPSQTCPGTACRCFFIFFLDSQVCRYSSSTRGACPLSREKMSSVIRFAWRPDRNVIVDLTKGAKPVQADTTI